MLDASDMELLRDYARRNSEPAFETLVSRHINLVYSVALRSVGNPAQAEEITQAVFIILARKAARLHKDTSLSGWMYETARLTSAAFWRGELRRIRREQEAFMQSTLQESDVNSAWTQLGPVLEEAMAHLGEKDRNAVVLRFFENKSAREIAAVLEVHESAAQKRINRAVEKLRAFFVKRGITVSTGVLISAISIHSVQAAPAGLVSSVAAVAALKGAATGGSTLTLVQGVLKLMAWSKAKTAVVGAGILLAIGTATVTVSEIRERNNPTRIQVLEIVRTNNWNYLSDDAELQMLAALGSKALPPLKGLVEWRETALQSRYEKLWPSLPAALRNHLADPHSRREMHRKAVQIVHELGPAAVRPLTSSLCGALDNADWQVTTYALRSLYWSIPESPRAVAAITNWISDPTRSHLFGDMDSWELYTKLPQAAPLLVRCLRNEYLAREAAIGLGKMGTNAASALSALIEVCDSGVAEPPLMLNFRVSGMSPGEPFLMNRCAAFESLGKIGIDSPQVLGAINLGLADADEDVRFAALSSLATLHQPLTGRLVETLKTFAVRRSIKFQRIIEWAGTLGAEGREALPWLRQFVASEDVQRLPAGVHANSGDFVIEADYVRSSAMVAICRIEPEETRGKLPDLIAEIGRRWEPVKLLMDSNLFASEIVTGLEFLLSDTNRLRPAIAAYVILAHEPHHSRALATLRNSEAYGELNDRLIAAQWLWKRTGEGKDMLPLCRDGLAAPESHIGQNAANTLEEMGSEARPAITALKAALWHRDRFVRERSGKALRKIAPEEMPPIH